jgi:hypothetical protein
MASVTPTRSVGGEQHPKNVELPAFSPTLRGLVAAHSYEPDSLHTQMSNPEPTTDLWTSSYGIAWTKLLSLRHEWRRWMAEAAFTTQLIQPESTALSARSSP